MKISLKSALFFSLLIFNLFSCGSKKVSATENAKEIVLPITNFQSDNTFIRSISSGTSPNMSFAKELAFKNAANEIAKTIDSRVKTLLEDYARQSEIDASIDYKSEAERMATISADQSLKNARIAKEKIFQNPDKTYTYWVGVELNKEEVFNAVKNNISSSKIKALHTEKVEFRETFNKNFQEN
jgi:hypothetical protein